MSSKRRVLDLLHRDELATMVERHGVVAGGRAILPLPFFERV
jgi:hypothetical protein